MGEGKGQIGSIANWRNQEAGHMAIGQERAAHEFWVQWKDKHPCYCGTMHSRDCYMKFAAAYAAECVRAERKRIADLAFAIIHDKYDRKNMIEAIEREG